MGNNRLHIKYRHPGTSMSRRDYCKSATDNISVLGVQQTWSYTVIMYSLWLSRQSRQFTRAMPIMDPAHRRRATHPELKDNDQIIDECKGEGVLLFSQIHRMLPRLLFNSEVSKSFSYGSATSYLKNFIVLPLHQTFYLRHCLSSRMKDVGYIFH